MLVRNGYFISMINLHGKLVIVGAYVEKISIPHGNTRMAMFVLFTSCWCEKLAAIKIWFFQGFIPWISIYCLDVSIEALWSFYCVIAS